MVKRIEIENYKSIEKLAFELGRFNVFIGENGCGKTNILEAIVFGSTADEPEKLPMKGVRIAESKYFKNGFNRSTNNTILINYYDEENNTIKFQLTGSDDQYSNWQGLRTINGEIFLERITQMLEDLRKSHEKLDEYQKQMSKLWDEIRTNKDNIEVRISTIEDVMKEVRVLESSSEPRLNLVNAIHDIIDFLLYAPENSILRNYNIDTSYIQPLGSKGEGLLKLIKVIKDEKPDEYKEIIEYLHLLDWFLDIEIKDDSLSGANFNLTDIYLEEGIGGFDIRNANEGFFLLLFYITLFVSDYTPSFFAIDNIDTALNPKLCTKLIETLAELCKKHNKQVLITTHNPAILDGINLNDPEQRLFAVSRNKLGYTRVTRIEKKPPVEGEKSLKLSEQFLRGYIGGIPKNF